MLKQIHKARAAGNVKRYHTASLIKEETVGQHSFNVVNLVLLLTDGAASRALILASLAHDMGEYAVGDIPSPTKNLLEGATRTNLIKMEAAAIDEIYQFKPTLPDIYELHILKLADNLDGLLKCMDELSMGNMTIIPIAQRYHSFIVPLLEGECVEYKDKVQTILNAYVDMESCYYEPQD